MKRKLMLGALGLLTVANMLFCTAARSRVLAAGSSCSASARCTSCSCSASCDTSGCTCNCTGTDLGCSASCSDGSGTTCSATGSCDPGGGGCDWWDPLCIFDEDDW